MISCNPIILTPRNYTLLEGMHRQLEPNCDVLRALLARKLTVAEIVFAQDIEPEVATLNSRVRFRIDGGATDERTLVWRQSPEDDEVTLPISVPRGLTLLGMRAGQTAPAPTLGGEVEHLTLLAVLHQPESALLQVLPEPRSDQAAQAAPQVRVTSLCAVRERRAAAWIRTRDGDDPGPSAA